MKEKGKINWNICHNLKELWK